MSYQTHEHLCRDAWSILEGACNPRAVARALVDAVDFAVEECRSSDCSHSPSAAPARIILSQLSYLIGHGIGDYPRWQADYDAVEAIADPRKTRWTRSPTRTEG